MAWIESHQGLERHPKTLKLSTAMGWDIDQTIGKLHRLWWWCLDYASDGNVSRHSADIIAQAVGLSADNPPTIRRQSADMGEMFLNALYDAEFLDKTVKNQLLIHDWLEYAGRYLRDTKFRRNPEKIQEIIALYKTIVSRQSADNPPTIRRKSAVPNLPNLPNLPNQESKDTPPPSAATEGAGKKKSSKADYVFEGIPDWINQQSWDGYIAMRKKIRAPLTEWAKHLTVLDLKTLRKTGYDPNKILDQSSQKSWRGVFPIGGGGNGTGRHSQGKRGTSPEARGDQAPEGKYTDISEELPSE